MHVLIRRQILKLTSHFNTVFIFGSRTPTLFCDVALMDCESLLLKPSANDHEIESPTLYWHTFPLKKENKFSQFTILCDCQYHRCIKDNVVLVCHVFMIIMFCSCFLSFLISFMILLWWWYLDVIGKCYHWGLWQLGLQFNSWQGQEKVNYQPAVGHLCKYFPPDVRPCMQENAQALAKTPRLWHDACSYTR